MAIDSPANLQNQRVPWMTRTPTAVGSVTTPPDSGDIRLSVDPTTLLLRLKDSAGNSWPLAALNNYTATAAPIGTNDNTEGYSPGSVWVNVTAGKAYTMLSAATGLAVWTETTGAGGGGGATELDYTEFTSTVTPTATSEASADTVVTAAAISFDGSTDALIEFHAPSARPFQAANRQLLVWLYDGSSSIGRLTRIIQQSSSGGEAPVMVARRLTPSNASHTYSARASVNTAGAAAIVSGAGGSGNSMPGFIRITTVV